MNRLSCAPAALFLSAQAASAALAPVPPLAGAEAPAMPGALLVGGDDFHRAMHRWTAPAGPAALVLPFGAAALSSPFGLRADPVRGGVRDHEGIDIPEPSGTLVAAAAADIVSFAGWVNGYGNLLRIDHGAGVETRYGHLSAIAVGTGTVLGKGAIVGRVGSTGRSTGPHLHFEVRRGGVAVDPLEPASLPLGSDQAPATPVVAHSAGFDAGVAALPRPGLTGNQADRSGR